MSDQNSDGQIKKDADGAGFNWGKDYPNSEMG